MNAPLTRSIFREVVITKLRAGKSARQVRGWLVSPISVGGRIIVREPGDKQMTSSKIRRLLVDDLDSNVAYVETQNSTYRVQFLRPEDDESDGTVQVAYDADSREITLVETLGGGPPTGTRRPR